MFIAQQLYELALGLVIAVLCLGVPARWREQIWRKP